MSGYTYIAQWWTCAVEGVHYRNNIEQIGDMEKEWGGRKEKYLSLQKCIIKNYKWRKKCISWKMHFIFVIPPPTNYPACPLLPSGWQRKTKGQKVTAQDLLKSVIVDGVSQARLPGTAAKMLPRLPPPWVGGLVPTLPLLPDAASREAADNAARTGVLANHTEDPDSVPGSCLQLGPTLALTSIWRISISHFLSICVFPSTSLFFPTPPFK